MRPKLDPLQLTRRRKDPPLAASTADITVHESGRAFARPGSGWPLGEKAVGICVSKGLDPGTILWIPVCSCLAPWPEVCVRSTSILLFARSRPGLVPCSVRVRSYVYVPCLLVPTVHV